MKPVRIGALSYKIGLHGKVFYRGNSEWCLSSTRTPQEIKKAIEKREYNEKRGL